MHSKNFPPNVGASAKSLAPKTDTGGVTIGKTAALNLDDEALAGALFSLADQIHARHPGLAAKYGWVRLDEVQTFTNAVLGAAQATRPDGLL